MKSKVEKRYSTKDTLYLLGFESIQSLAKRKELWRHRIKDGKGYFFTESTLIKYQKGEL